MILRWSWVRLLLVLGEILLVLGEILLVLGVILLVLGEILLVLGGLGLLPYLYNKEKTLTQ